MPREKSSRASKKRKKKVLKEAKGNRGGRKNLIRTATEAVEKGWNHAYKDRRRKKREFRRLWITRINAAARKNGMSYSKFIHGLKEADVELNRKMLADLAVRDEAVFAELVDLAKSHAG